MLIELHQIPEEAGGRKSPIPDDHRLDCSLASEPDKHYMCRLMYRARNFWYLQRLLPDGWPEIELDTQIIFREGHRVVAVGVVTK